MAQQYGTAYHKLSEKGGSAITLTPHNASGAVSGTIWASPEVRDIKITPGGRINETVGIAGTIAHFSVQEEFVDVTFTLLPAGSTRADALKACTALRVGTPVVVANAPVVQLVGHEASVLDSDLLNSTMYLQSHNIDMMLENDTSGQMTLRYYPAISATVPTT